MPTIDFVYDEKTIIIECKSDDKMEEICKNLCKEIKKDINSLTFIYDNQKIKNKFTFIEQANIFDKELNNMLILVFENDYLKELNNQKNKNEITLIYRIDDEKNLSDEENEEENEENEENKINIFCSDFVGINKELCSIIYKGQEYKLDSNFYLDEDSIKKPILTIQLKGINNITNISTMFSGCSSLLYSPDISKWDTSKITWMSSVFSSSNFTSIPDISSWDTSNVESMHEFFWNCRKLLYIPDISKWNTSKVEIMDFFLLVANLYKICQTYLNGTRVMLNKCLIFFINVKI